MALAWTGRVDAERGRIVPEGSCCLPPKKLGAIELPLAPAAPEAKSPVGMVIESGKPIWIEDITAAPVLDALFRDATGLERGAAGLLPLIHDGQVARILFLFVRDPALLDLDARRIFVQMASDLSFALDGFAKEAHKGEIEANLRESEERYRTMFAEAMLPLLLTDPESGRIVDGNRAALAFYGYSHDELTSMRIWEINMLGREAVLEKLHAAEEGKERRFSFVHRLKSGELRDVEVYSAIIRVAGERRVQSSVIDVTARNRAE